MRCVLWTNGVALVDWGKPPLRHGYVMGKLVIASLTHIERLISLGVIPAEVGRTLGSVGVIRVVEVGTGVEDDILGGYFILLPKPGLVGGVDVDGVLADYVALPVSALTPISEYYALRAETLLHMELSYIYDAARYARNRDILVIGCGPTSYVTASYLKGLCNVHVACLGYSDLLPKVAELGVHVSNVENVRRTDYDIVLALTASSYGLHAALRHVKDGGLVLLPPTIPRQLVSLHPAYYDLLAKGVRIRMLRYMGLGRGRSLGEHLSAVRSLVGTVGDFDELLNSMFYFWRILIKVGAQSR